MGNNPNLIALAKRVQQVEQVYRIGVSDGIGKFLRVYIFSMIAMFLIGYLIGDAMYLFR
jgi:hypothetical protein